VRNLATGAKLDVPTGTLVTPLARQVAMERRIELREGSSAVGVGASYGRQIAIGADHGGFALKETLKPHLQSLGYEVTDCGAHSPDPVDYPDIAYAVARLVADGKCIAG